MPAIAAKMESSASVELVEMKRADKNALGKSIDTICGYVREKILQARKPETSRFYILSEKTWRTSAVTIWLHPRTTISAISDVVSYKVARGM
jgi:hypothetical protein